MIKILLVTLLMLTTLNAGELTSGQKDKLNSPRIKIQDTNLVIEEFSVFNFNEPISLDQLKTNKLIIKTYARMSKNTINKEQFLVFSSTLASEMIASILSDPKFSPYLRSSEFLTAKPKESVNLTIELLFTSDGIDSKIYTKNNNITNFIPYSDMFSIKLK